VAYLKDNGVSASAAIIFGKAGDALIKYARDHSVDLIIIGTHGRSGITRVVRGSVAEHVLQSGIPVLMIKSVADSIQSKSSP
jgi:nucleotide-binding universal stress UspA family protein